MKIHLILFCICFLTSIENLFPQNITVSTSLVNNIIKKQAGKLDTINQLVLVLNNEKDTNTASLITLEKKAKKWKIVHKPIHADIGRNGFAEINKKREGDGKSPSGLFKLGVLFTYLENPGFKIPYIQSTTDDKWIDDPESPDYNKHIRGSTNAKSYERLKLKSDYYKYCMIIEYNTNPVVKGNGSAIFFHLSLLYPEPTAGCVGISENEMLKILKWLDKDKNPAILMGKINTLLSDF